MQKERIKILWIVAGAILFNWVFWQEEMAINTLFYDLFLLVVLFSLYPNARQSSTVRWLLAGHLLCLAMVIVHNTALSKFGTCVTLLLVTAFAQFVHRSVLYAGGSIIENFVFAIPGLFESVETSNPAQRKRLRVFRTIRFIVFPVLIALLFFVIYSMANSVFLEMVESWGDTIFQSLENFFKYFSFSRFGFLVLGLFITAIIILKSKLGYFSGKETVKKDDLSRVRVSRAVRSREFFYNVLVSIMGRLANGMMAMKNMNTVGLISLLLLNVLLLIVNGIDISFIWFGYKSYTVRLYDMVHEGANLLIISIILAILVLLVFFKGNLNFYQRNKWLKYAAYAWIFQNLILVVSVFLRDYYYIQEAGLGRNRIGILFYLLLVVIGLVSVYWKIHYRKTVYFLMRVNSWAAILLLIAATTVDWDQQIVNYNLSRRNEIVLPVFYMVELSDNVLPTLDKNREELKKHIPLIKKFGYWEFDNCENCWESTLDARIAEYKREQVQYSWLSWSRSDAIARTYFKINAAIK